jgi:MSHA pilin protein MshC
MRDMTMKRSPHGSRTETAVAGRHRSRGFSVVELVLVLVILAALATVALPRFFGVQPFDERRYYDEVINAVRYAQQLAVASGCAVEVRINANAYRLRQRATCTSGAFVQEVRNPATGESDFARPAPNGIALVSVPASFVFDALGASATGATVTVGGRAFGVTAGTGYVQAP